MIKYSSIHHVRSQSIFVIVTVPVITTLIGCAYPEGGDIVLFTSMLWHVCIILGPSLIQDDYSFIVIHNNVSSSSKTVWTLSGSEVLPDTWAEGSSRITEQKGGIKTCQAGDLHFHPGSAVPPGQGQQYRAFDSLAQCLKYGTPWINGCLKILNQGYFY